jgi:ABC-2 type transport system permease protein
VTASSRAAARRPGWRAFAGFVRKEGYHILRDWQTLLVLLGMPLLQVLLFGFAIRSDVRQVPLAFVEPMPDAATAAVRARFAAASGTFRVVGAVRAIEALDGAFRSGGVRVAVVFPNGLARRLGRGEAAPVQLVVDGADPNTGGIMEAYARAVLQGGAAELGAAAPAVRLVPVQRMRFNPTLASVNLFVPGLVAFVLTIVSALMTAVTIAREKETGTMEMLLVSPLRPWQVVAGKVAPYLALGFANVLLVLTAARLVFDVPVRGSLPLLLALSLLYTLTALAMGIVISSRAATQRTAMLAALAGLMLPTLLLSGFIFPIEAMPLPLRAVSHLIPARWFILIVRGIMLKGAGVVELWQEMLVLAGLTILLLAAGVRRLAVRLG